ncbi:MAG: sulfotransferase family protein [Bacteroidota bacterium]
MMSIFSKIVYILIAKKQSRFGVSDSNIPINLDDTQQLIYIHIPKNAGTSIAEKLGFEQSSHATISQIQAQLSPEQFERYFKFSFVRNPFDRFLSLYNYARLKESRYHSAINPEKALWGKHLDYDLLEHATLNQCAHYLLEGRLRHDEGWNHWLPQVNWLKDGNGNIPLDFIGRVETIPEDFKQLATQLNIDGELPYLNKSKRIIDYKDCYDKETQKIVSDYYKEDLETFGYQF